MLQAFLILPAFALAHLWAGQPALGKRLWQLLAGGAALIAAAGWWVVIDLQLTFGYNGLGRLTGSDGGGAGGGGGGGSLFGGATGITRLFECDMGSQISWLLPAALIAVVALLWLPRRSPRTDRTRAAALLWGGWLVVTALVFSYLSGVIHPYYTVALAPAIAALVGIGGVALWRIRHTWAARVTLAGTLLVTAS
jgi:4-amino-4-deoxy-L-arabinose transferase-like glycosyltransferase